MEVTSTNYKIISAFMAFLEDLGIGKERFKVQLQIHQGDDQEKLENLWAQSLNVSKDKFNKTIVRPVGNKIGKSNGTCKVRFADKRVYLMLESMLPDIGV